MTPTIHPLADAYLRDLEQLLHGLPAGERAEVLLGVRDHLEEALGPEPTDDQVSRVLGELGPAEAIADEAYAAGQAPSAVAPPARARSWADSRWVPAIVATVTGLGLLILVGASAAGSEWMVLMSLVWPTGPLLAVAVVLVAASRLWTGREKALLMALVPAAHAVLLGLAAAGKAVGTYAGAWVGLVLVVVAAPWLLSRLVRSGLSRAA